MLAVAPVAPVPAVAPVAPVPAVAPVAPVPAVAPVAPVLLTPTGASIIIWNIPDFLSAIALRSLCSNALTFDATSFTCSPASDR